MSNLSEANQKRLRVLQAVSGVPQRLQHLIPDFGDDDALLAWFEQANDTLRRMAISSEARRLGYLDDGQ